MKSKIKVSIFFICLFFGFHGTCFGDDDSKHKIIDNSMSCDEVYEYAKRLITVNPSSKEDFDFQKYDKKLHEAELILSNHHSKCQNDIEFVTLLSNIKKKLGSYDDALKYAKIALNIDKNYAMANYILGEIYIQKNDYENGLKYIRRALAKKPNDKDFLLNYCGFLLAAEKHREAIKVCTEIISKNELEGRLKGYIYYTRGMAYKSLDKPEKAQKDFSSAKQLGFELPFYGE